MPMQAKKEDIGPPGAGTLFVYDKSGVNGQVEPNARGFFEELTREEAVSVDTPDVLLDRGIADYTFLPASAGGVLGKGKFSTVYKVTSSGGNTYALKHTPLHPHHPLISSRLLREPTLLAQLPPHPCLIGVDGWVRTEGHFYLIEQYAGKHVPLPSHPLPMSPTRAAYILDQLVSVVRDGLHNGGRVCHRDLKGENVLVDIETGDILLLDLGLATHYSASQPRLTTCCGSPAFHSPEIVNALNHPAGVITYYGPELDIWCLALTMLSLLLQTRFPLGPTHTSRYVMQERVRDRLQELDELYPPNAPWRGRADVKLADNAKESDQREWRRVRKAMADFLEIDGTKRMRHFGSYDVGERVTSWVASHRLENKGRTFKTTTFIPTSVKYTLPIYLEETDAPREPITLRNTTGETEKRILSYLKYLLRCSGILYHTLPDTSPTIIQLVLPLPPSTSPSSSLEKIPSPMSNRSRPRSGERERVVTDPQPSLISTLFSFGKRTPATSSRSASMPPKPTTKPTPPSTSQKKGKEWATKCWIKIEFEGRINHETEMARRKSRKTESRASSRARYPGETGLPGLGEALERLSSISDNSPLKRRGTTESTRGDHIDGHVVQKLESLRINGTTARPHPRRAVSHASSRIRQPSDTLSPLSRQVSLEPDANASMRPGTLSRRATNHSTTTAHRQNSIPIFDTVVITSSEPRAYDLLRKALDVRHVDSPLVRIKSRTTESVKANDVSDSPEWKGDVIEIPAQAETEERGRGRSKEISRSPHKIDEPVQAVISSQLDVKLVANAATPVPSVTEISKGQNRDPSGGRKGILEGWFGRGSGYGYALETGGVFGKDNDRHRSSSLPPPMLSDGLFMNNM